MKAWFLSDIHLKSAKGRNGEILLRFLHFLESQEPSENALFLLGDIFDLWVGGHQFFVKKYSEIVQSLGRLREKGVQIVFVEGNHDLHVDSYFSKKLKIPVFVEAQYFQINGLTVRVEHGDLINLDDKAYLRYRSVVRHPLVRPLANFIPGSIWGKVGNKASEKSRKVSSKYHQQNQQHLVDMIRSHAHRTLKNERPFDILVSGHMHVFDEYQFSESGRQAISYNLGSWLEPEVRVLCLEGQSARWETLK